MSIVLLILPDFLLIALGWLLLHRLGWTANFFRDLEKLVYYVLFPALLFHSIVQTPIELATAYVLLQSTAALTLFGVVCAWLALPILSPPARIHASINQTAYRFNTYMGLSLASSLGEPAQTAMAVLIGFAVPMVNLAAVHSLARHQGGLMAQLVRNPLILATTLGLAWNLLRLPLPPLLSTSLMRLGVCALAIGLLCVGATLSLRAISQRGPIMAWMITIRLLLMPIAALVIGHILELSSPERLALLIFGALPTASSAHVLAARMGGEPQIVALTMSVGTVLSAITLPLWLFVGQHL